jgi:hypothetical protein
MLDMVAVKRTLRLITASFAAGAVVIVIVLAGVSRNEPQSPDLADGALLAVAVIGLVGLVIAAVWYARAGAHPSSPAQVQMGYIIRIAVAELGLLLGVLAIFLTGTLVPALTGLGLFLVALLMLYLGLNQIPDS